MTKLLIFVFIAWILGKLFGSSVRKKSQAAGRSNQGQHQAAPGNRDALVEQQRERAEAYRRLQAMRDAQSGQDGREHPWSPPEEPAQRPQPVRTAIAKTAAPAPALSPSRPAARPVPVTSPAPAVRAVAPPATVLPQLGFGHDDLIRAMMMAEILGPCKARRAQITRR